MKFRFRRYRFGSKLRLSVTVFISIRLQYYIDIIFKRNYGKVKEICDMSIGGRRPSASVVRNVPFPKCVHSDIANMM